MYPLDLFFIIGEANGQYVLGNGDSRAAEISALLYARRAHDYRVFVRAQASFVILFEDIRTV